VKTTKPLKMERSIAANHALKMQEVAAHQHECGCHPALGCACKNPRVARDFEGISWHIDPLCKVRPEATC
jgi:hypothetical protein